MSVSLLSCCEVNHLFQSGRQGRRLSFCQLKQFMVESRGDEAFKCRPEVIGISAQALYQLPAQTHSLHTQGLFITH